MACLTNEQLIEGLCGQMQRLAHARAGLAQTNSWDVHDIRLSVFTKIENAVGCTTLGIESMTEFFGVHRSCRDGSFHAPISPDVMTELAGFYKLGFMQFVFATVESSLRTLLRALNPTAAKNGTAELKSIYERLIRTELDLPDGQGWIDMLDLFRFLRNTLHNNGVNFHKSIADITITYRGRAYQFMHGQQVDFVYWDLCLSFSDDAINLVITILAHPRVVALPFTQDPFAPTSNEPIAGVSQCLGGSLLDRRNSHA